MGSPRARRAAGVARGDRGRGPRAHDRSGGRNGVAGIQRARMIAAMAEVARERGAAGATVASVVARSGVSRRTFYELFEDRNDCFGAAFDQAIARASQRVLPAYTGARGWRERMRAGVAALLEFLEDESDLGSLCVVAALGASPSVLRRRAEVISALVDAVDEGRELARDSAQPTRLTAEAVVGAVLAVLHARLLAGESTIDLSGPLMGMIVLPYLGLAAAAREEAAERARDRPAGRRSAVAAAGDPLRGIDMRLTYRTVRVLTAIGALGEQGASPSNRQVADAAGVSDQGQISKLLARLEHLGLIRNHGGRQPRGERNLWSLTPRGAEIERTIRRESAATEG